MEVDEKESLFCTDGNLKCFECAVTGTQSPLNIMWYLDEICYCGTPFRTWNDGVQIIKSSLNVSIEEGTSVTCVVNGTLITTTQKSLISGDNRRNGMFS